MSNNAEFRIAVEVVIKHENKVLVMKRSDVSDVAPGAWCVPAGKAKFSEVPEQAAVRECLEETGLKAKVVSELDRRAITIKKGDKEAYRLIFTYLMQAVARDPISAVVMNDEHSELVWVTKEELKDEKYNLLESTKRPILEKAFDV